MLIDAGNNGKGNNKIIPFLESLNITSLDFIVTTHYHSDHIGGIDEVVHNLSIDSIGVVYDRNWSYSTATYNSYADKVSSKRETIVDNQVIDLGAGVYFTCVSVNGNGVLEEPYTDPPHDENDLSVALKLTYGEFDFFVGGDLSGKNTGQYTDIETSIAPEVGKVEVLRVNHHGSNYSSNQHFLDTLQPIAAIISVGSNTYGHPHPDVIERLESAPCTIYQTEDEDGNVIDGDVTIKIYSDNFWVNGDRYSVHTGT
jgi:competence protein ComEC